MKAILVIDIEHDDFDDIENRGMTIPQIYLYSKKSGERLEAYSDLELKPLPQKKDAVEESLFNDLEYCGELYYAVEGWNACIDEILGGHK